MGSGGAIIGKASINGIQGGGDKPKGGGGGGSDGGGKKQVKGGYGIG